MALARLMEVLGKRDVQTVLLEAAIARGELPADVNQDDVFAMAAGPLFFRTFVIGRPVDDEFIAKVVDQVCAHYCRQQNPNPA